MTNPHSVVLRAEDLEQREKKEVLQGKLAERKGVNVPEERKKKGRRGVKGEGLKWE